MTTLGTLVKGHAPTAPLDLPSIARDLAYLTASAAGPRGPLGSMVAILASLTAWTRQDDDAHEPCSLVACRAPLHPGPCKGWKGTLHSVAPGTYKQIEEERVAKANARRVKRIADLRAQGKPIPRRLLTEIKPKPAPGSGVGGAQATPLSKVNQQADLAGGQAHRTSQAINQQAGITTNTAPLPTGPKGKKPTVAGRGPAFVITQPKVTDQYKLDKAAKLTADEWDALSPADKKAIRDELEAIKIRGFGPQQTKADALLAKLPAQSTLGTSATPAAPQVPSATPGKTTLGQATKTVPGASKRGTTAPSSPAGQQAADVAADGTASTADVLKAVDTVGPGALNPVQRNAIGGRLAFIANHPQATDAQKKAALGQMKRLGIGGSSPTPAGVAAPTPAAVAPSKPTLPSPGPSVPATPKPTLPSPGPLATGPVTSATQADTAVNITEAIYGKQAVDPAKLAVAFDDMKAKSASGEMDQRSGFKMLVDRLANGALKKAGDSKMPGLGHGANDIGITDFNHQIRDHILDGKPGLPPVIQKLKDHLDTQKATPSPGPAAPASQPNAPAVSTAAPGQPPAGAIPAPVPATKAPTLPSPGPTPQAPGAPSNTPKAFPSHVQFARATAGRAVGTRATSKNHLDTYGTLTKADFDSLDQATQRTIRDDLANASAKFLDPAKKQAARDLLNRFGSSHPSPPAATKLPVGHQATLDKIASGVKVVGIGNGHTNPGLADLDRRGLVEWDPTSKQFKLTDAGKARVTPAAAGNTNAPAAPNAHPKGYSDPQQQAVKAVATGSPTVDVLKAVARLTPAQVNDLDDDDKRIIKTRLGSTVKDTKVDADHRRQAAAFIRAIDSGSPAQTSKKWDHAPSLGELHREEDAAGLNRPADAVAAANTSTKMDDADRLKALTALTKLQFGALPADDQRNILDALQAMHRNRIVNGGTLDVDAEVEKAFATYVGTHPALHRLEQAEADFKAGKITGDELHSRFLTARTQAPLSTHKAVRDVIEATAARIARDNPTLPMHVRARLVGDPKYGTPAYDAIGHAQNNFNWQPAPRFSAGDFYSMFRATDDDLKAVDPIHAQAVRDLRVNIMKTGLDSASPWSTATKDQAINALLGVGVGRAGSITGPEVGPEGLAAFKGLPPATQAAVVTHLKNRLRTQTNNNAKTETHITLRELEGLPPLTGAYRDAMLEATEGYAAADKQDVYRRLDPVDFQSMPTYTRDAIREHLDKFQAQAQARGATHVWTPTDNALKVLPAALKAHLDGDRAPGLAWAERNARDIALFGTGIVSPESRVTAYNKLTPMQMQGLPSPADTAVFTDLDKIEYDSTLPLQTRYDAAMNAQIFLKPTSRIALTPGQVTAVQAADLHPSSRYGDAVAAGAFGYLTKADFDTLSPVFREAIDERIKGLPGTDQQVLTAKFHPQAAVVNLPSGTVPTTVQANVPANVQSALNVIYGTDPKSHTMARQLAAYGGLRGSDFGQLNVQEQQQVLSDLSFIETTAKGPSASKAYLLINRFTPAGTPPGQTPANPAIIPPANSLPGQVRYATPQVGTLVMAKDKGKGGDGWVSIPGGKSVWGKYGAAGLLLQHVDPNSGEKRYLMVQRGPGISDPGKWQFPGGAIDEKESFHQGGAREVIEELGFKPDDLKSAGVVGEHTNAIPGSTWKYVSIAATVPTMLKPDLSSHHARMETADAKWMTEAEIKALDTSGSLLAPLAGGKLEQNVMSLFPAGTGKLGQVTRPGPVTKRLNRLMVPSGGRQAPGASNAWTKPHKPSTGKNLVGSKADIDAQRQKIKNDRKLYDAKTADGRLAAIGAQQGYDDTPTVVSKADIDRLLATGDYIEAWRGVSGSGGGWSARSRGGSGGKTAAEINEEMRSGPAYYGKGIFGNGYYLATQKRVAEDYSDRTKGSLVRILIPKSAVMEKYDKVEKEAQANSSRYSKAKGSTSYEPSTFWDPGRWGAAKGLDGIEINPHHTSGGGGARHVAAQGKPAFNWLNRSVLIIQKEPG